MSKLRVVVAEDHEGLRAQIVRLLSSEFEVVDAVGDGMRLVSSAVACKPNVIVSDVYMPLLTGPQAMRDLKARGCEIPFVFISTDIEFFGQRQTSFVPKIDLCAEIVPAVCTAASGERYVPLRFRSRPLPSGKG